MPFQPNNPYIDTLILKALRQDDEAALNHLFSTYYNRLYRTGLKYGATNEAVGEAIQAVFIDVWQYRQTLGEIISFEAYLKGALRKRLTKMALKTDKNAQRVIARHYYPPKRDFYFGMTLKVADFPSASLVGTKQLRGSKMTYCSPLRRMKTS